MEQINSLPKPYVNSLAPDKPIRVSVSEAARLFGLSLSTIRKALKDQELRYVVVRGRYKISFQSLVAWSQKTTHRQGQLTRQGIGQFVEKWKIKNRLYSPNPKILEQKEE